MFCIHNFRSNKMSNTYRIDSYSFEVKIEKIQTR